MPDVMEAATRTVARHLAPRGTSAIACRETIRRLGRYLFDLLAVCDTPPIGDSVGDDFLLESVVRRCNAQHGGAGGA